MRTESAERLEEAVSVLRELGFDLREWVTLSDSNRLIVAFEAHACVAKIVPRAESDALARELAIAKHCANLGAPVVLPAPKPGPYSSASIAVTLWQRVVSLGTPSDAMAGNAYGSLREGLDSFSGALPDFRVAIRAAQKELESTRQLGVSDGDARLLHSILTSGLGELERLKWRSCPLHGDAHVGNLVCTAAGALWLDFEAACSGPVEWDLSSLPESCAAELEHDEALLSRLRQLRRACVVSWCVAKPAPTAAEIQAIFHHLQALKSESRRVVGE